MWSGGYELQTGAKVGKWHRIPLDLFHTVFLLQTHKHMWIIQTKRPVTHNGDQQLQFKTSDVTIKWLLVIGAG